MCLICSVTCVESTRPTAAHAGQLREVGELDALVRVCRLPMSSIEARVNTSEHDRVPSRTASAQGFQVRAKEGFLPVP